MAKALAAIVCGMPFSGTTFLSRILCAHPLIDSGFEGGLLLGKEPKNFPQAGRFYEWMMDKRPPYNWKLTQSQLDEVCASENFDDAYQKIVEHCHLFQNEKKFVLDKTPAYVYLLKAVFRRAPDAPVIVIEKDKLHQYYSFKKREQSIDFFEERYLASQKSLHEIEDKRGMQRRLLRLPFEEVAESPAKSFRKVINFIGKFNKEITFEKEYVALMNKSLREDMKGKKKLRAQYSIEAEREKMMKALTPEEIERINQLEFIPETQTS